MSLPEWGTPPASEDEQRWRLGYLWMRLGRYDRAFRAWSTVVEAGLRSVVRSSRATALRELGLHERAQAEDRAAGTLASTAFDHARVAVGLVADAVGLLDRDGAGARLRDARRAVSALDVSRAADRQRIRLGWVEAEVALLAGGPYPADLPRWDGQDVHAPAVYDAGSQHHLAKGLAFAGLLARDLMTLDEAARRAPRGLAWAVHLARADLGAPSALHDARAAWSHVRVPPSLKVEVASTATFARLTV